MRKLNIYAFYKGEECLSIGTVRQIAEDCGILPSTVRFFGTQSYVSRVLNNVKSRAKVLIKVEDMEVDF